MIFKGFPPAFNYAALFAVTLLSSSLLHAGASNKSGNPYGNGTQFQTTGTFSSVVRGQNLTGTMMFSTGLSTNTTTGSAPGICNIVYAGYLYAGNASGNWDPSGQSIAGVFQAGNTLSGSNTVIVYPELYNTNFPQLIPIVANKVSTVDEYLVSTNTNSGVASTVITNSYTTNTLFTNYITVEPKGFNSFQDSIYMVGSFSGKMNNDYPNQTFNATGSITQQQLYPQQITQDTSANAEGTQPVQLAAPLTIPVTVQGVRISDTYASYASVSNSIPYSQTTYTITNISGL